MKPANAALRCLVAATLGAGMSACGTLPFNDARIDPQSPVAAEVVQAARTNKAYPKFTDIPPVPKDVRPLRAFGRAADEIELARAKLERETAPDTWTLNNTQGFAATARAAAGPDIPPASAAETEAFAKALRARATPPPPTNR